MESSHEQVTAKVDPSALQELASRWVQRFSTELIGTSRRVSLGGFIGLYDNSRSIQIVDSVGIISGTHDDGEKLLLCLRSNCMAVLSRGVVSSSAIADFSIKPAVTGGAIMLSNGWVLGFEGFTHYWNEAFCTALAVRSGLIDDNRLQQIMDSSRNPQIETAIAFVQGKS